jgi:hypothetical protein
MGDTKRGGLRSIAAACLFAALTVVQAPAAFGQTMTTGGAAGTVTGASGAMVSGAKVTIHLAGADETRSVVANATGESRFSLLMPGGYTVTGKATGLKSTIAGLR